MTKNLGFKLYTFWKQKYKERAQKDEDWDDDAEYRGNYYSDSMKLKNCALDRSEEEVKEAIEFYINTDRDPTVKKFAYRYDRILEKKKIRDRDREYRRKLRDQTARMMEGKE